MDSTFSEESIRHLAYLLWEADSRPDGRDEHYWHLATTATNGFVALPARRARLLAVGRSMAQCGEVGPWDPSVARYSLNRAEFVRCTTS
ncbi:DUF2934 domain-containing protein [Caballeronia telluris]|uniref:DUF2934 domain-containing protein n=1 Tax=Caballeronia telluris TaxID=326475 RepID=UPI000B3E590D|nr:DUF2934 domain-containing protein [Caballeronia telluris]